MFINFYVHTFIHGSKIYIYIHVHVRIHITYIFGEYIYGPLNIQRAMIHLCSIDIHVDIYIYIVYTCIYNYDAYQYGIAMNTKVYSRPL